MRNFFYFIIRHATTIFFIILEVICLILVFSFNDYQQAKYISTANSAIASVYEVETGVSDYFSLSSRNDILARENSALHDQLDLLHQQLRLLRNASSFTANDTLPQRFIHRAARVVKSTTNREHNYLTIDRGSDGGIREGMVAIDHSGGVVGLVTTVSDNFSTVLPVINTSFRLSSKLKKSNFRGQLVWDGVFPDEARLIDIPEHAVVSKGDSIVTSGSSNYFPEGLYVGKVKKSDMDRNGGFYDLTIELATDFSSLYDVYIIEDLLLKEQQQLESQNE
ncbi:MAG: rod shape-determining protein MreC [Bacteroidales bacterium]|nr:rod shape-determining protein MreC [Bacteroidales bacterium]